MNICKVESPDFEYIVDLVINVARIDIFPGLSETGQANFMSLAESDVRQEIEHPQFRSYKVLQQGKIVAFGVIKEGNYITKLFVAKNMQQCGIGKVLLARLLAEATSPVVELKASLNAVPFYLHQGFEPTGEEGEINGIRFLPMKKVISQHKVIAQHVDELI
jgi:predicted GNAT family N-acyltransferase